MRITKLLINWIFMLGIPTSLSTNVLSRKKRFLVFPEGASFSAAVCLTVGIYGNPVYSFVSYGLNWGFAYDLPHNASDFLNNKYIFNKRSVETAPMMQRRFRRDFYDKMEVVMNEMGYNGRNCILRALCESSQYFGKRGSNMIEELLRTIFSFPKSQVLSFEHRDLQTYDTAHRQGKSRISCHTAYPNCGFSILDLALGKYSKPLKNFM